MPKAVIFDMDGVIIDSEPLWRRAMVRVFNESGLPFTEADCRITTGMRIDEVIAFWNKKTAFTTNEQQVRDKIEDNLCGLILAEGKPMPGLQQSLQIISAQKATIALATSSSQKLITCVLSVLKIESYFAHIQSAEHLPYGKPHPEVFIKCAQAIHKNPSESLVIEDSLNGVIAAKAAQMQVIAVPDSHNINNQKFALADMMLHSLSDFTTEIFKRF